MAFNWFWRIIIAVIATCLMFWFLSLGIIYVIVIIPAIAIMIWTKRRIFVIVAFLSIFFMVLFGVMAYLGYAEEMEISANFFMMVYDLIIPSGVGNSWSTQLPLLLEYVLPSIILIVLFMFSFAKFWKREKYDKWLAEAFSFTLLTFLFIYTIICIFAVLVNLYDVMSTQFVSLLVWELLFVWLPFLTLFFILYWALGFIFRRI